jgi:hypothetical protein
MKNCSIDNKLENENIPFVVLLSLDFQFMNVFYVLLQTAGRWIFQAEPQTNVNNLNASFHFLHNKYSTSEILRNISKEEFIFFV